MYTCDYIENKSPNFKLENRFKFKDDTNAIAKPNKYQRKIISTLVQLIPLDVINICKIRIGSIFDGGYVILNKSLEDIESLYSIGVDHETYFEEHYLRLYPQNKAFKAYMYDHTIDHLPFKEHP